MKRSTPYFAAAGLVLGGLAMTVQPLGAGDWPASALATLGFALPGLVTLRRWGGSRRGWVAFAALGLYALVVESAAVATGVPYGRFSYSTLLGPRVAGLAPLTVLVAWTPLVVGVAALAWRRWPPVRAWRRIVLGTLLLVATDAVLDPGAVALGFWHWERPGGYYGVPLVNFIGWCVSGALGLALLERLVPFVPRGAALRPALLGWAAALLLWAGVNLGRGRLIPVAIAGVLIALVAHTYRQTAVAGVE